MSDSEKRLRAQIAAHESWARTEDRTERTERGRRAFEARFERQVDPDGTMAPSARVQAAESARKAYYAKLALKGVQARRARRQP
jgi:hypothetical protein